MRLFHLPGGQHADDADLRRELKDGVSGQAMNREYSQSSSQSSDSGHPQFAPDAHPCCSPASLGCPIAQDTQSQQFRANSLRIPAPRRRLLRSVGDQNLGCAGFVHPGFVAGFANPGPLLRAGQRICEGLRAVRSGPGRVRLFVKAGPGRRRTDWNCHWRQSTSP